MGGVVGGVGGVGDTTRTSFPFEGTKDGIGEP